MGLFDKSRSITKSVRRDRRLLKQSGITIPPNVVGEVNSERSFNNLETKVAFESWLSSLRGVNSPSPESMEQGEPEKPGVINKEARLKPNPEHLKLLKQGKDVWNKWRADNPNVEPDLGGLTNDDLKDSELWGEWNYGTRWGGTGALLAEFDLHRVKLIFAELSNANLEATDLFGANLVSANLSGANIWRANLTVADLRNANLSVANLVASYLNAADFSHANLSGASLVNANLSGASLFNANLSGASLFNANLSGASLFNANLSGADLGVANLSGARLFNANLSGARLVNANLSGADLGAANLSGANLEGAKLTPLLLPIPRDASPLSPYPPPLPVTIRYSNLSGCDLVNADFTSADLTGSNLTNANLISCVLEGTNVALVTYERKLLSGKCYGVSADGMYGDATFRRDVMDQDYIDTLYVRIEKQWPELKSFEGTIINRLSILGSNVGKWLGWVANDIGHAMEQSSTWFSMVVSVLVAWVLLQSEMKFDDLVSLTPLVPAALIGIAAGLVANTWFGRRMLLGLWHLLGYGRDWDRVAIFASLMIALFGTIYSQYGCYDISTCDASHAFEFIAGKQPLSPHPFYPWYIAALGFATLGISDLIRPLTGFGMLMVTLNVVAGFSTLGLLLAVLSDRFARRA